MSRPRGRALEQQRARQAATKQVVQEKKSRGRTWLFVGLGVIAVGVLALLVLNSPPPPGIEFPSQGNTHLAAIDEAHPPYNSSPPSSGWHVGNIASWAEHEEALPPELFVHNLEDGGVVLTYDCSDGCEDLVAGLREILADYAGENILITPYAGIVNPLDGQGYRGAVVAWTRVFYFDDLGSENRREVEAFINSFEGIDHHVTSN